MKKILLSILIITGVNTAPFAQGDVEKDNPSDFSIATHKNQLEVNVRDVFTGLGGATMLYKRVLAQEEGTIKLLRFLGSTSTGLSLRNDGYDDDDAFDRFEKDFFPATSVSVSAHMGYEVQKVRNRFVHYYGAELFYRYDNYSRVTNSRTSGSVTTVTSSYTVDQGIGVTPFFGVKYYFTDRLNLGVETAFNVWYSLRTVNSAVSNGSASDANFSYEIQDPMVATGINASFGNLRLLTLGYSF